MNKYTLWSLRLGFSGKQAPEIRKMGIQSFLQKSFRSKVDFELPVFLNNEPKTGLELRAFRQKIQKASSEEQKQMQRQRRRSSIEMRGWWLDKMRKEALPLREKMVVFWHNHFVSTIQKVKVNYWVYQHNMILRENAFGNFRELTKKILKSNAMVRYLDNVDNRKGRINENLSRELLELFTLGIGNYTEEDIKGGARGLAGLNVSEYGAVYRRFQEDNSSISYLGQQGVFKVDELVDIIFEQTNAPYLITRKILKWFIYDQPNEELVHYYGDYFRSVDFEIKPLLTKIFSEEFEKENSGNKIKDPLVYSLQLFDELGIKDENNTALTFFLQQQGMNLFNQPNVKGWVGGNSWLTPQILLQRNNFSDMICSGRMMSLRTERSMRGQRFKELEVDLNWEALGSNKHIIKQLTDRLLFNVDESLQLDLENILKYDFDPASPNADQAVLRLFNYITKTPEFQLI